MRDYHSPLVISRERIFSRLQATREHAALRQQLRLDQHSYTRVSTLQENLPHSVCWPVAALMGQAKPAIFPVTSFYASLCGLLYLALTIAVVKMRRQFKLPYGDGGNRVLGKGIAVCLRAAHTICSTHTQGWSTYPCRAS